MDAFYHKLYQQSGHAGEDYDPDGFNETRLLIVGAGGIGCEVIKNLVLMGVKNIDVVDMDQIDVSNLNRQFLFRDQDVGLYKAQVAVRRILEVVDHRPDAATYSLNPMTCKVQDIPLSQLAEYSLIITALDNVEARRWVNNAIFDILEYDDQGNPDPNTMILMIDGGSEGLDGQARFIAPGLPIPCYECSLYLTSESKTVPLCTLAHTPRSPEHCIQYARIVSWPDCQGGRVFDADDMENVQWVHDKALDRARDYNITPFDVFYTLGILKNIVPAVASTNALVGAHMSNLALRVIISHYSNPDATIGDEDNYLTISGDTSLLSPLTLFPNESCPLCSKEARTTTIRDLELNSKLTLEEFIEVLKLDDHTRAHNPTLSRIHQEGDEETLYMPNPAMRRQFESNLTKSLLDLQLFDAGVVVEIHDNSHVRPIKLRLLEHRTRGVSS